jgi:hypothetical protein
MRRLPFFLICICRLRQCLRSAQWAYFARFFPTLGFVGSASFFASAFLASAAVFGTQQQAMYVVINFQAETRILPMFENDDDQDIILATGGGA